MPADGLTPADAASATEREIALRALRAGNPAGALHLLVETVRKNPDHGEAYLQLAAAYEQLGEAEEVRASLQRAVVLLPHHQQAWQGYAAALEQQGHLPPARFCYERAAELAPEDPTVTEALIRLEGVTPADPRPAPKSVEAPASPWRRWWGVAVLAVALICYAGHVAHGRLVRLPRQQSETARQEVHAGLAVLAAAYRQADYDAFIDLCNLHGPPPSLDAHGLPTVDPKQTLWWLKGIRGWGGEELWSVDWVRPVRDGPWWRPRIRSVLVQATVRWKKGPTTVTMLWVKEPERWRVAAMRRAP